MILTLQCHLFDHTICNGNSTLYSKMGRISSISWGNGAQNYVCRHPVWRLYEVFSKFSILNYSSCFKLIPMILTLQCHLFDHTISVTEIQRSTRKWGAFCQYRGGMGLKITFVDTQLGGLMKFFLSSQYSINRHVSNLLR